MYFFPAAVTAMTADSDVIERLTAAGVELDIFFFTVLTARRRKIA